jgi:hypothetical protein
MNKIIFQGKLYNWDDLSQYQINMICEHNYNFDYDEYWDKLTNYQKTLICENNDNFDAEKYKDELTDEQKDVIKNREGDLI